MQWVWWAASNHRPILRAHLVVADCGSGARWSAETGQAVWERGREWCQGSQNGGPRGNQRHWTQLCGESTCLFPFPVVVFFSPHYGGLIWIKSIVWADFMRKKSRHVFLEKNHLLVGFKHNQGSIYSVLHLLHLSLNCEGCWGTTDYFTTSFLHFSLFFTALLDLIKLQAYPFPDVVFPPVHVVFPWGKKKGEIERAECWPNFMTPGS